MVQIREPDMGGGEKYAVCNGSQRKTSPWDVVTGQLKILIHTWLVEPDGGDDVPTCPSGMLVNRRLSWS